MTRQTSQRLFLGFLLLLIPTTHVRAQGVTILNETLSRCTIFQALRGRMPADCANPLTKVLVFTTPPAQVTRSGAFATTRIQFAFDSALLTPDSRQPLDILAEVLADPSMAAQVVRIEGHTDNIGSTAYNQRLSTRRAQSVQDYLHTRHGIPLGRIPALGKGFYEPYDPQQPGAALNRRVQFVNLSE
jgi:outer membrane protein OmpA-like peptidoglycan-associated protein